MNKIACVLIMLIMTFHTTLWGQDKGIEIRTGIGQPYVLIGLCLLLVALIVIVSRLLKRYVMVANKEQQLKNEKLALAIHAGKIDVWGYDIDRDLLFNIEGELFPSKGISLAEGVDTVHPEDRGAFGAVFEKVLKGEMPEEAICVRFKNMHTGQWEYVEKEFAIVRDRKGKIKTIIGTHKDVTDAVEKKQKDEALSRKYQIMLSSIRSGIEIRDVDGNIMETNEFIYELFGVENKTEFLKFSDAILRSGIILEEAKKMIVNCEDNTIVFDLDFDKANNYFNTKRTGVVSVELKTISLLAADGTLMGSVNVLTDITKELEYRRTLEGYKIKIELALQSSDLVQWNYDCINQVFISHNEQIKTGEVYFTPEDYIQAIHPDDHAETKRIIELMNVGRENSFKFNKRIKYQGEDDWRHTTVNGVGLERDSEGRIIMYTGFRHDNTLIHSLNTQLAESSELMQIILEKMPIALMVKDVDDDFRYVVANRMVAQVIGLDLDKIVGKTDFDIFDNETACRFREDDKRAVQSNIISYQEETNWNGRRVVWYTTKSIITSLNGHRLLIGMLLDITSVDAVNKQLEQAKEKAEQADKLKSAFLANMSHEIRTPLNSIVGFSELILSTENEDEKKEYAQIIQANNNLLLRIINDILDLSKIESGMMDLRSIDFDFSHLVDELSASLRQRVTSPDVEFIVESPYEECLVHLDSNRVAQVFTNFVTNSIKHTVRGSVTMGYEYVNSGIRIYVTDTGKGIPKEKQNRVFQRFEKLDDFSQGTGLGLSICKAIVDAYNGEVGFESESGKGSTFWAWIPCEAQITGKPRKEA